MGVMGLYVNVKMFNNFRKKYIPKNLGAIPNTYFALDMISEAPKRVSGLFKNDLKIAEKNFLNNNGYNKQEDSLNKVAFRKKQGFFKPIIDKVNRVGSSSVVKGMSKLPVWGTAGLALTGSEYYRDTNINNYLQNKYRNTKSNIQEEQTTKTNMLKQACIEKYAFAQGIPAAISMASKYIPKLFSNIAKSETLNKGFKTLNNAANIVWAAETGLDILHTGKNIVTGTVAKYAPSKSQYTPMKPRRPVNISVVQPPKPPSFPKMQYQNVNSSFKNNFNRPM